MARVLKGERSMEYLRLRDGTAYVKWEPTTDLICSICREPLDITPEGMGQANFVYDMREQGTPWNGHYWYEHKKCSHIENALDVSWGWHPIGWVLGLDTILTKYYGSLQKTLKKHMPPGDYDRLYSAWLPALARLKGPKNARARRDARARLSQGGA